jgi:hypothetical protein
MEKHKLLVGLAAAFISLAGVTQSQAALVAFDGFVANASPGPGEYTEFNTIGGVDGGTGFTAWNVGGFDVNTSSLSYGGYATTGGSVRSGLFGNNDFITSSRGLDSSITSGLVTVSWLWSPATVNTQYSGFGITSNAGNLIYVGDDGGSANTLRSSVLGQSQLDTGLTLTSGTTYLNVVTFDFASDTLNYYFNPALDGSNNPILGSATQTVAGLNTVSSITGVLILGTSNGATAFDEIGISVIPEPSTYVLLLGGLALLGFLRRTPKSAI